MPQLVKTTTEHMLLLMVSAFALTVCLSLPLQAQRRIPMSENERNERDLADREFLLRTLGKFKKVDLEVGPRTLDLPKIKRDFEGLQLANNNILSALASKRQLDNKQIGVDVSNIRRRASSLKSNLSLPETDAEKIDRHNGPLAQPLPQALLDLDKFIVSFVSNPIFKSSGVVVDVTHSAQARRDLESIIDLSERIRRHVTQLELPKNASASQ